MELKLMNSFFPIMVSFFTLGIYLGSFICPSVKLVLALCAVLFLFLLWSLLQRGKFNQYLLILLIILLGLFRCQFLRQQPSYLNNYRGEKVALAGTILQEPDIVGDKLSFIMQVDTIQTPRGKILAPEKVLVESWDTSCKDLSYGDRVQVEGQISSPAPPANFGGFNYKIYLLDQGIQHLIRPGGQGITLIAPGEGNFLISLALRVKKALLAMVDKILPSPQAGVLKSLLFGERDTLEPAILQQIEAGGVLHLLAVSGLHVGFVAGLSYSLGMFLNFSPRIGAVVSGVVAGLYLLLIGFRASVVRAGIMLWVGISGIILHRRSNAIIALSVAGMVLLWIRPGLLYTPGFQLSFAATWGILYLYPSLGQILHILPPWLGTPLAISAAAQLATWPIVAYHFQGFATYAVFNNLIAVPLAGAIMGLGLISCGLGFLFLPLARILGAGNGILITLFLRFTALTAALPGAYPHVPPPQLYFLPVYYGLLFLLPGYLKVPKAVKEGKKDSRDYFRPLVVILIFLLLFLWFIPTLGPSRLEVTFLSVGAGDAAVVRVPGGKAYLIDTGPGGWEQGFDAGNSVVVPYLQRQRIRRLEYIFLTHPHQDHWGGLNAITSELRVGGLVLPPDFFPEEFGIEGGSDIALLRTKDKDRLNLGPGVEVEVLHPPADLLTGTNDDANNNSLVLYLKMGEVSFLFTGDLEAAGEEFMLQYNRVPPATILKVGHHGARNSSGQGFLNQVRPTLAVISTGPNSSGHPHRETLERLERMGIITYRTDIDGAVKISTDGKRVWVKTARRIQPVREQPAGYTLSGR